MSANKTVTDTPSSYLIVGGGVFGLSTALELATRHPTAQITLFEGAATIPNPHGSSVDSSRIVRADYAHPAYSKLGFEAVDRWRNTDWGRDGRYTQSGFVLVTKRDDPSSTVYVKKSYENVRSHSGDLVQYLPSKDDICNILPGYAVGPDVNAGYVNWGSGWSDAEASVAFARKKVEETGRVTIRNIEVQKLVYSNTPGDKPHVTGVELVDGTVAHADLVVLATGAWTGKLVDLRGRAEATGQVLAYVKITDEEQRAYRDMPTLMNFSTGMFIIPPRRNVLKIARHGFGYRNLVRIPAPGPGASGSIETSLPTNDIPIPAEGEKACRDALREMIPALASRPFCHTRVCWYTDTPQCNFIITYHPSCTGLFIATGGSGHGYKFLPVIGERIVDAMDGCLDPHLHALWAWPFPQHGPSNPPPPFEGAGDGSRSGAMGMILSEELAKTPAAIPLARL